MHVVVIDVGSPKKTSKAPEGNLGWWISGPKFELDGMGSHDLDQCVSAVTCALNHGPVALGFEAPMFVPKRDRQEILTKARCGESSRSFSAGAGATVLTTALTVVPYVLSKLKEKTKAKATIDWKTFPAKRGQLLLFEAFVTKQTGSDKGRHMRDAHAAVLAFGRKMPLAECKSDVCSGAEDFNLLGAAMLRTGWTKDVGILCRPCLVVKAREPKGCAHATRQAAEQT